MKGTILEADRIYRNVYNYTLEFHRVVFQLFNKFNFNLRHLNRSLGINKEDDYWREVLYYFKHIKFLLIAMPLSPKSCLVECETKKIDLLVRRCEILYPQYYKLLKELYDIFQELISCHDNPLLKYIIENFDQDALTGVVLKTAHDLDAIQSLFNQSLSFSRIEIIGVHKLRNLSYFDRLLIIGPYYWYPSFVYDSPRSKEIHTICLDGVQGNFSLTSLLDAFGESIPKWYVGCNVINHPRSTYLQNEQIEFEQSEPEVIEIVSDNEFHRFMNIREIRMFIERNFNQEVQDDVVQARLLILSGNYGIFIEENSEPNIQVIFLNEGGRNILSKVPLLEVSVGSYILLRTGTERDYVNELADKFLGEKSELYRKCQQAWKKRLRKLIHQIGITALEKKLLKNGSKTANEVNIRNWSSNENICPRYYDDFLAIMKSIQLEEKAIKYWKIMKLIHRAHMRAGVFIRKQLLDQIAISNLSKLELEGKITFRLPKAKGASFTAYRVENVVDEIFSVPIRKIKEIFPLQV